MIREDCAHYKVRCEKTSCSNTCKSYLQMIPRRPLDDGKPEGYLESDRDFVMNNLELAVLLLENYEKIRNLERIMGSGLFDYHEAVEWLENRDDDM